MIDGLFKVLQDSTKNVNSSATIYVGRPVALNSSAEVVACDGTTNYPVYGLAMGDKNTYRDDTYGKFAAFGSGKMGAWKRGIFVVEPTVYTTSTGSTTVQVYDNTRTYSVNDKLYCSSAGLITNDNSERVTDSNSELVNYIGRVTVPPTSSNTKMEIELAII